MELFQYFKVSKLLSHAADAETLASFGRLLSNAHSVRENDCVLYEILIEGIL